MAKRFVITLLIVLAVIIFLGAAFFLVLFLAPGFAVFGLRYIAADARMAKLDKVPIAEYIVSHDDNYTSTSQILNTMTGIKVESTEMPVKFILSQGWNFEVEYYDNYNGFTTTNIEYPSISIQYVNNVVEIKTTEFEKILGEMTGSSRYLNVYLPLRDVGSSRPVVIDLEINSARSNISFEKERGNQDERTAQFREFKVTTNGQLNTDSPISCTDFTWKTSRKIVISETGNVVSAVNYDLESYNSSISVETKVAGDLITKTGYGDINFVSVGGSFYATTEHGDVTGSADECVGGLAFITTKSGNISIPSILGPNGNSKIESHSGNVTIKSLENAEVTTTRGTVDIDSVYSAKIVTNLGKVAVEEVRGSIDVNTKRGNVYVGGNDMVVNNPKIFSRLGKVYLYAASGETNLETISGNIEFTNSNSDQITINCGGKLTAKNLTSAVKIVANKDMSVQFASISKDVDISLGDGCNNATIECPNTILSDVRYSIVGKYVEIYEQNDTGGYTRIKEGDSQYSQENATASLITIKGKNAQIKIYFKSAGV